MNFFAHYFYYNKPGDSWYNAGLLFPDLLRIFTQKQRITESKEANRSNNTHRNLHQGIAEHFKADTIFHNWNWFIEMNGKIALEIRNSKLNFQRDWFLSHIFIELAIDHVLVSENENLVRELYTDLEKCQKTDWLDFFEKNNLGEIDTWYDNFVLFNGHKYILTYKDTSSIVYALNRICQKSGVGNFNDSQSQFLVLLLKNFIPELKPQLKELKRILE